MLWEVEHGKRFGFKKYGNHLELEESEPILLFGDPLMVEKPPAEAHLSTEKDFPPRLVAQGGFGDILVGSCR